MDRVRNLVLFALLTTFVGDAVASCKKVANEDMLEYVCEGGYPADLTTVPETTGKLRIIRMPLDRITADTFSRFGGNLWVLSCSHCEITDIDADAFRRLVNLQQLSLDNNRLTTVQASWFEGLDFLTYLDLNYNDIRDIEDGVYKNLPSLVDLRISGNRLQCLNLDEMLHLKELKRMFLSENSDFACPHAVSKFLENQGVTFEQDPEWTRLASDTINAYVPPIHVEEDEIVPPHRERLHLDRKSPPEASEELHATKDKTFYPDPSGTHRSRHRKPPATTVRPTTKQQEELPYPRVEPRFPDTRPSHIPSESSPPRQVMPYSYSTPETPRAPSSEDIKMPGTDEPSQTEHILTYPSHPTHETTPHWSYPTPERSRAPSMTSEDTRRTETDRPPQTEHILMYPSRPTHETVPHWSYSTPEISRAPPMTSEDIRRTGTDGPPQTEHILTYPSYIPVQETVSYPSYPTSERSRVLVINSSEDETLEESSRSSQAGNTITYPLYVTTSDGLERIPHGSIQVTRPSSSVPNMIIWSTDDSVEQPVGPTWMPERHEESHRSTEGNDKMTGSSKTPYYEHDLRKIIFGEPSSETDDKLIVTTDRSIEYNRSQTMTIPNIHYVRPSSPELMHSPSTNDHYQAPYYESTVTVHPPLQNYQGGMSPGVPPIVPIETTTDKPLPECQDSSAPKIQPTVVLMTFIIVTILGHAVVGRF